MTKRTCSIDGCDRAHNARGFCHSHYQAARRAGMETLPTDHLHKISDADRLTRRGVCSICGPVKLSGSLYLCDNKIREIDRRYQKTDKYKATNNSRRRSRLHSQPKGWAEQYLEECGWKCQICAKQVNWTSARFDHDHKCCPPTLKRYCGRCFRGVLCASCNLFLGWLENPDYVSRVTAYLEEHQARR